MMMMRAMIIIIATIHYSYSKQILFRFSPLQVLKVTVAKQRVPPEFAAAGFLGRHVASGVSTCSGTFAVKDVVSLGL